MDRGVFIKDGFSCTPGCNGGWIVQRGHYDRGSISQPAAFSTFHDMIAWLQSEHVGLMAGAEGPDSPTLVKWNVPVPESVLKRAEPQTRHFHETVLHTGSPAEKPCGYLNCSFETPFFGCEIHRKGSDSA